MKSITVACVVLSSLVIFEPGYEGTGEVFGVRLFRHSTICKDCIQGGITC